MDFVFNFEGENGLPSLIFNETTGNIKIYGKSILLDKNDFYVPLIEKIKKYLLNPIDINLSIDLEYFNTVSARCLMELFKTIKNIQINNKKKFVIFWYYEDEDIKQAGLDFRDILKSIEFIFINKINDIND